MSDLYFQLSYPVVEGPYGKMITVLAPVNGKDEIELEKGMLGNAAGTYLSATGKMKVTKGKYYNTYDTSVGKYIGIHHLLNLKTSNGQPFALMVLISKTNYDHIMGNSRKVWIIGSLTFLICLLFFSFVLSKRFVKPILQSLRAIQEDEMKPDVQSVIYAVDRLITYLSSQKKLLINKNRELPKDVEDMINDFISRVETLTSAERSLLQCFIEGDSMQGCADKLCISIGTARKHNTNMNRKLGISSRKELLLYIDLLRNCNRLDSITNPKS